MSADVFSFVLSRTRLTITPYGHHLCVGSHLMGHHLSRLHLEIRCLEDLESVGNFAAGEHLKTCIALDAEAQVASFQHPGTHTVRLKRNPPVPHPSRGGVQLACAPGACGAVAAGTRGGHWHSCNKQPQPWLYVCTGGCIARPAGREMGGFLFSRIVWPFRGFACCILSIHVS